MGLPLVSIGMPVRNGGKWIRRALDSLLIQTYPNFELIISDNASDDETEEICREYAKKDNRIRYTRNQENIGMNANFKKVLDLSKGKYFMWAAVDDYWYPDFVRRCVEELETHPEAGVAMTALQRYTEDGEYIDSMRFEPDSKWNPNNMSYLELAIFCAVSKLEDEGGVMPYHFFIYGLFRRDLLSKAMEIPIPEVPKGDRLFMTQIALATKFRYIDEFLHMRTVHVEPLVRRWDEERSVRLLKREKMAMVYSWIELNRYLWCSTVVPGYRKYLIGIISDLFWRKNFGVLFRTEVEASERWDCGVEEKYLEEVRVGKELVRMGRLDDADKFLSALELRCGNSAEIMSLVAELRFCKLREGTQNRAEAMRIPKKILLDILKDCPAHKKSLVLMALILEEEGEIGQAIEYLKRAEKNHSDDPWIKAKLQNLTKKLEHKG